MKTVGILGGGQLGLLLAQSLQRYGANVHIYDPNPSSPALKICTHSVSADWNDRDALLAFFKSCDVVTYEFENVSTTLLKEVQQKSRDLLVSWRRHPSGNTKSHLRKTYDRKKWSNSCPFLEVPPEQITQIPNITNELDFPAS